MKKTKLALAIASVALASSQAHATNGMNMDGYGPIATAMGGTASAYDNGLAGMMSNPATIMMDSGDGSSFQIALGNLRPNVESKMTGMPNAKSAADSFFMPGIGYATKNGKLTWGVGIMAQGGMGTDYGADSFLAATSTGNSTGDKVFSQVGVGRVGIPVNYAVNNKLTIGGSVDFVWAGLDLKMAAPVAQLGTMADTSQLDGASAAAFGGLLGAADTARFDFADDSDYTGEAKGTGFGGKLGFTYKVDDKTTIGASYHTKTNISDLTTSNGYMQAYLAAGTAMLPAAIVGDITVKDFQWPATISFGLSTQVNNKWKVNADFKRIGWEEVMASMKMDFKVTDPGASGLTNGSVIGITMPQNWEDQNVMMIGTEYQYSNKLALRAGANLSSNPVPDTTLNALFPAIIENHYTAGFGYEMSDSSVVDFSLTYAPEVSATNPATAAPPKPAVTTTHSQISWQAMYTRNW